MNTMDEQSHAIGKLEGKLDRIIQEMGSLKDQVKHNYDRASESAKAMDEIKRQLVQRRAVERTAVWFIGGIATVCASVIATLASKFFQH